ncbi:phosphorylase, partial [bacterium B13(2017)]
MFYPGNLLKKITQTSKKALRSGHLKPIITNYTILYDNQIPFIVYKMTSLKQKEKFKKKIQSKVNPFLPYDKNLYVCDISKTHICLLNKYNVVDHHILIVTRKFEQQESLLNLSDFDAILKCMKEFEGLG